MHRDLLWYLFWFYCESIHFKNYWKLFSDICHLLKDVFATLTLQYCHYKEKSVWECIGTSYGTFSDSVVCPFTLKTTGIYSLIFFLRSKSVFCNPRFPLVATFYSLTFIIYTEVFLLTTLSSRCCSKRKFVWECIGTSYGTFSDSIVCPLTLQTTEIILWHLSFVQRC